MKFVFNWPSGFRGNYVLALSLPMSPFGDQCNTLTRFFNKY